MRGLMVVMMVIGGLLLAALIAGIVPSNLRFFTPGATADANRGPVSWRWTAALARSSECRPSG